MTRLDATVKVLQIKTKAQAHIILRDDAGRKLFDAFVVGASLEFAVPADAEIKVVPDKGSDEKSK